MEDRREHLDPIFFALAEQVLIEPDSLLIGLGVVAVGIDSRPVDRGPQYLNSQFMKQPDVLFVSMVKINSPTEWIMNRVLIGQRFLEFCVIHAAVVEHCPLLLCPRRVKIPEVLGVQSFSALIIGAVGL